MKTELVLDRFHPILIFLAFPMASISLAILKLLNIMARSFKVPLLISTLNHFQIVQIIIKYLFSIRISLLKGNPIINQMIDSHLRHHNF